MIVPKYYLSELDCANVLGKAMFDYPRAWDSSQAVGINVYVFCKSWVATSPPLIEAAMIYLLLLFPVIIWRCSICSFCLNNILHLLKHQMA